MNVIENTEFQLLDQTLALRHEMYDLLTDDDLNYALPGDNPTIGELLREWGDYDRRYADSFRTFVMDYTSKAPDVKMTVSALKRWFDDLEVDLKNALSSLSDEDIEIRVIERGFPVPVRVQFHIYREGLLIMYGKLSVYFKALGKSLPPQWQQWIG
jgi:hypothetical protein